jgi:inorganic pyrophosphatase
MPNLAKLPTWADKTHIRAVVETPRGSHCKLEYDLKHRVLTLAKPLLAGLTYPYDWGFIPSTAAEDGDPLDVLMIHDAATYPGLNSPLQTDRSARSSSDHQGWDREERSSFCGAGPLAI